MMKVVVVGAGPAGLAATYALKKKRVDVMTFERSDNVGGRAQCVTKDGFICDMGAQFLGKFYETTFRFCDELGMSEDIVPFNFKAAIWRNRKFHVVSDDTSALSRLKAIRGVFRGVPPMAILQSARMGPRIIRRLPAVLRVDFDRLRGVDHLSFADFVLKYGGKEALENIFQAFCAGLTLGEPENIGTAHALSLQFLQGSSRTQGRFWIADRQTARGML